MLDDGDGRDLITQFANQFIGGICVIDVVVGQFLALQLFCSCHAGTFLAGHVEGGFLVRVFAIAQRLLKLAPKAGPVWSGLAKLVCIPIGNCGIIGRCTGISFRGQLAAESDADMAIICLHFSKHCVDIKAIGADGDEGTIFCRRTQHGRTTDIDVLDASVEVCARGNRRLKRIEIYINQVDRANAVCFGIFHVGGIVAQIEQTAMHRRVKRLDPAVHHFRKACQVGNIFHIQAGFFQKFRCAAGGDQFDPLGGKLLSLFHQSGLVGHGKQGAANANGSSAGGGICHVENSFGAG